MEIGVLLGICHLVFVIDVHTMSFEKSPEEIAIMAECGKRLKQAYGALLPSIQVGETTNDIEHRASKLLIDAGLEESFKKVPGYRWATCLAVNDQAVHTPPSDYVLKSGDLLTVDMGGYLDGYHTDWATSFIVGEPVNTKVLHFLTTGERALAKTLQALRVGEYIGIVGQIMQNEIERAGYRVLRDLTGHGIGRELHEDPYIPNVVIKPSHKTYRIQSGFVAAIEIIYAQTTEKIVQKSADKWSLDTADGSLAACFEHTVAITQEGVHILT